MLKLKTFFLQPVYLGQFLEWPCDPHVIKFVYIDHPVNSDHNTISNITVASGDMDSHIKF